MAKSNSAEAMPKPEPDKEEEIIDMTDEVEIVDEGNEEEKSVDALREALSAVEDRKMAEEAKKKTELHRKKAKEATKRKKDVAQLRQKLAEVKMKREASTAEIKEHLEDAREKSPEEIAKEKEEDKARAAELKEMAKDYGKKAAEPEEPEIEVTSGDPTEGSAEQRIAFANLVDLPNFDHNEYDRLLMEKEKQERNLAAIESGDAQVGWFAKRRMKKRYKKILKQLKPYEEELVDEMMARKSGKKTESPAPKPEVGTEKPMEHGLVEDMDYHAKVEAANRLQKEIDEAEETAVKDTPEIKKKRKEMKKLLKAIEADEKRLGK